MTTPLPDRSEWDFDSCPDEELELCFEYERARNSVDQWLIKDAESWRQCGIKWKKSEDREERERGGIVEPLQFARPMEATFDNHWSQVNDGNRPDNAFPLYPEFPLHPYLSIPAAERARRFQLLKSVGIYPVGREDGTPAQPWGFDYLQQEFDLSKSSGTSYEGVEYEIEGDSIRWGGTTFAVFRFDWRARSDKDFIDELRDWLERNRRGPVEPEFDARGGGSLPRKLKSQLHYIGAWRLLNSGMTWEEAANHTQAVRDNHKPLYSEQAAWSRAKSNAERLLGMCDR